MESLEEPVFISDKQAARLTGLSRHWFQRARWAGTGPAYVKLDARVLYDRADLIEFFRNRIRKSTSDPERTPAT